MRRYFITLAYNGKNYCGWQIQPNGITIQEMLQEKLSLVLRSSIAITGAGRTDSGVHAKKMIAHFDYQDELDGAKLTEKINRMLPNDIYVYNIQEVTPEAHARFSALSRKYEYIVSLRKDPFSHEFQHRINFEPDIEVMNEMCKILFQYTDFTSFSKLHTDVKTNNCKIYEAQWEQREDKFVFTIKADRFLRNMVRAIVGTMLLSGRGKLNEEAFRKIIEEKKRSSAGESVPGKALFIIDIEYPEEIWLS